MNKYQITQDKKDELALYLLLKTIPKHLHLHVRKLVLEDPERIEGRDALCQEVEEIISILTKD